MLNFPIGVFPLIVFLECYAHTLDMLLYSLLAATKRRKNCNYALTIIAQKRSQHLSILSWGFWLCWIALRERMLGKESLPQAEFRVRRAI